jgi:hypothetical protein
MAICGCLGVGLDGVRRCKICGFVETDETKLHIHHKDGNDMNDSPDNLMLVCPSCHGKIHIINNPMMNGRMNFGERVKAGLVAKIYGSKTCPKCGQLGYGLFKIRMCHNPKLFKLLFLHRYRDLNGKVKQTHCYIKTIGKRIVIKGSRRVESWVCGCGRKFRAKLYLIEHVMQRHGFKDYEGVRRWIVEYCRRKVRWVRK